MVRVISVNPSGKPVQLPRRILAMMPWQAVNMGECECEWPHKLLGNAKSDLKSEPEHQREPAKGQQLQVERRAPAHYVEGGRGRGHRDGRTKLYVAGYEYTRANITNVKISYRCSYYRSWLCQWKLEFHVQLMDYDYDHAVTHTCTPPKPTFTSG